MAGAHDEDGDVTAEPRKGGTSSPFSNQVGMDAFEWNIRDDASEGE